MAVRSPDRCCSANTASLVGARTQSSRRRIVIGSTTSPYSLGLYGPRSRLAMDQMKLASGFDDKVGRPLVGGAAPILAHHRKASAERSCPRRGSLPIHRLNRWALNIGRTPRHVVSCG